MIIDGRALAREALAGLKREVAALPRQPRLAVIVADPAFATKRYIALKERLAREAGIAVTVTELPATATTADAVAAVEVAVGESDGIIVQLPLPSCIDTPAVLAAIPPSHDVDGMRYAETGSGYLPPVVDAIEVIAQAVGLSFANKRAAVVGYGRLVGQPVATYLRAAGATVTVISEATPPEAWDALTAADVVVSGVGKPGLITAAMLAPDAYVFDAGTAEDGGLLRGDVVPSAASQVALFTPVPGGIGPLTVVGLLKNVAAAARAR